MKLVLAACTLALTACAFDEFEIHDSVTDGPFEARVAVASGLDLSRVRAGLFRIDAPAEIELGDGELVDGTGSLDILVSLEGKAKLVDASSEGRWLDLETVAAVRLGPAHPGAVVGDRVIFDLPEPQRDDYFHAVVWYDEDDDGLLELSPTGASEFARSIGRSFPDDGQGRLFLFGIGAHPVVDDEDPTTWKATARGLFGDTYESNDVSDRELGDWSVTLEAASQ